MMNVKKSFLICALLSLGASQIQTFDPSTFIPTKSSMAEIAKYIGTSCLVKLISDRCLDVGKTGIYNLDRLKSTSDQDINQDVTTAAFGLGCFVASKALGGELEDTNTLFSRGLFVAAGGLLLNILSEKKGYCNNKNLAALTVSLAASFYLKDKKITPPETA